MYRILAKYNVLPAVYFMHLTINQLLMPLAISLHYRVEIVILSYFITNVTRILTFTQSFFFYSMLQRMLHTQSCIINRHNPYNRAITSYKSTTNVCCSLPRYTRIHVYVTRLHLDENIQYIYA